MKVRSYDALTDYDNILSLVKQEKLTALYKKDKSLYKEALSNSESFVCVENDEIIGFMRCISDFTYTTYVMEVLCKDGYDKMEVYKCLLEKANRLAVHGFTNIITDDLSDESFYEALGFKKNGMGMSK